MFIEIKSMPYIKESNQNHPGINALIREYNYNTSSSNKISKFGSVGYTTSSSNCNTGGKGFSYDPYTSHNCNINTLFNSH